MSDQNKEVKKDGDVSTDAPEKVVPFDKNALRQKINNKLAGVEEVEKEVEPDPNKKEEVVVDDKKEEVIDDNKKEVEPDPDKKEKGEVIDDDLDADPDDDDLDLDADPDDDDLDADGNSDDDDLDKNIVALRKKHEDLRNDYDSQEEKLTEALEQLKSKTDELEKYELTRIDPKSHPDFVNKSAKLGDTIHSKLIRLKGVPNAADKLGDKWGDILTDVDKFNSTPRNEKTQALNDLRLSIAQRLEMVDSDTTNLDPSVDDDSIDAADKVIDLFDGHSKDYRELAEIYTNIQSKAADRSLAVGYEEYQSSTSNVRQSLASIDTMSDKDIEEDPTSLQSLAAKKINSSSELRAKSVKIDKMLIELGFGAEALSQEELDRHSKSGKDMTEFQRNREKRVTGIREKRLPEIKAMYSLLPEIKKHLPEILDRIEKEGKKKDQKKVVRQATSKEAKKDLEKEEEVLTKDQLRAKMRGHLT